MRILTKNHSVVTSLQYLNKKLETLLSCIKENNIKLDEFDAKYIEKRINSNSKRIYDFINMHGTLIKDQRFFIPNAPFVEVIAEQLTKINKITNKYNINLPLSNENIPNPVFVAMGISDGTLKHLIGPNGTLTQSRKNRTSASPKIQDKALEK